MAYDIRLSDDGILRVAFVGDLTKESMEAYVVAAMPYVKTVEASGNPVLIIVDTSRAGKVNSAARKALTELGGKPKQVKVAVLGVTRYVRVLVGFLDKVRGDGHVHMFGSEEEAIAWLKAES